MPTRRARTLRGWRRRMRRSTARRSPSAPSRSTAPVSPSGGPPVPTGRRRTAQVPRRGAASAAPPARCRRLHGGTTYIPGRRGHRAADAEPDGHRRRGHSVADRDPDIDGPAVREPEHEPSASPSASPSFSPSPTIIVITSARASASPSRSPSRSPSPSPPPPPPGTLVAVPVFVPATSDNNNMYTGSFKLNARGGIVAGYTIVIPPPPPSNLPPTADPRPAVRSNPASPSRS